ncbi:MAG: DUF1573 domain-containing protein [Agriterribacter sp.]
MKKHYFLLMILAGIGFASCQDAEKKATETATIAPASTGDAAAQNAAVTTVQWIDSALNKGTINEGEKLEIVYRFKNTGDKPLIIKEVKPSCGCTVAEKPEQPIAPGEEGSIKAAFDSHNKPGPNHKTITVTANTQPDTYHLTFDVVVNKKS